MMDVLLDFLMKAMLYAVVGIFAMVVTAPIWMPTAMGAFRLFEWFCEAFAWFERWRDQRDVRSR